MLVALAADSFPSEEMVPLFPDKPARSHRRPRQFPDIQLALLVLIQSFEFCFHKPHVPFLGDHPIFVSIHKGQQLFDLILSKRQFVLRLWYRYLLCCRRSQHAHSRNQHRGDHENQYLIRSPQHDLDCLLLFPDGVPARAAPLDQVCHTRANIPTSRIPQIYTRPAGARSRKKRMQTIEIIEVSVPPSKRLGMTVIQLQLPVRV
jgi:hypothetical protein